MQITKFNDKLNCLENNIYTIEEVFNPVGGIIEVLLKHDNVIEDSINVYSGSKLTGEKITTYVLSTPSKTPWKTSIKIYTDLPNVYVTYETKGDTVEADDVNNLQTAVNETQTALNNEIDRSVKADKLLTDNLNSEISRAKSAESTITTNLNNEINRATNRENALNTSLDAEIKRAKAKESEIDTALSNRYTKSEVFTKSEVLAKIQDLINSAPEVLDTFGEIAEALGNDPNFAATMTTMLSQKVDKVEGKALSTNDFDNTQKSNLNDCNNKKHVHDNKSVLDGITSALITTWNNAYNHISDTVKHITSTERSNWNDANTKKHTHDNKSVLDGITSALITNWNNAYSHISDAIKHITSSERTLWNTVTNKVNKSGDTINGHVKVISDANPLSIERNGSPNLSIKFNNVTSGSAGTRYLGTYNGTSLRFGDNADLAGAYEVYHTGRKPTKSDVGLSNVDNTSDLNKPISTATQNALNGKLDKSGGTLTGTLNAQNDIQIPPNVSRIDGSVPYAGSNLPTLSEFTDLSNYKSIMGAITSTGGTWHNILSIRHRNGNGDGNRYGSYVRTNLTSDSDLIWNKQTGSSWIGERTILDSNNYSRYSATKNHTHTKSQITDMPTKLSQFTNDAGYITQAQVDTSQNHTHSNKAVLDKITEANVKTMNDIASGIGGRNLALKTSNNYSTAYSNFNGSANICPALAKVLTDGLKVGDTVTVKLLYKYTNIVATSGQTAKCWIQGAGNVTAWNSGAFHGSPQKAISGSGEHEFKYSFTVIADHLKNEFWNTSIRHDYVQSGSVQWKLLKIERGNIATDWSPAPEDMLKKGCTWNDLKGV